MNDHQSELDRFDVIVVGAGHAGCEAALAAARAGCATLVLTTNLDRVGFMPCNPSIGGPGKSHIVAEVDALGGEMGRAADRAALQVRLLNTSKGPAVQAVRAQADKGLYALAMKEALEAQAGLQLCQDEVRDILLGPGAGGRPRVTGVETRSRGRIHARTVIITAGTFLRGSLIAGESRHGGGRAGDDADTALAGSLSEIGFHLRRLKTGTPPRVDARTVDVGDCEVQAGSETPIWLSRDGALGRIEPLVLPPLPLHHSTHSPWRPQIACFRTSTTPAAHDLIRENLDRAPIYNGAIEGIGPRYCPSIEHKVARFGEKDAHPIFIEPEGWRSGEFYIQGFSTSLPFDVQDAALRAIPAFRNARITRYGYAVEYDAIDPEELSPSLESRRVAGLFLAGQVNGTSGYEEAAGQGIMAGLNAANQIQNRPAVILGRDQAYIGVMIDDLVTKPFDEPYRMLTSRAEYRLQLRPDTADDRFAALAARHGLISEERLADVQRDQALIAQTLDQLDHYRFTPSDRDTEVLAATGLGPLTRAVTAAELLRRPDVPIAPVLQALAAAAQPRPESIPGRLARRIEVQIKYGAFVEREAREIARRAGMEHRPLPAALDYAGVSGLRFEARQKLAQVQPATFGQAARLPGVTPSDIAALLVHTTRHETAMPCAS